MENLELGFSLLAIGMVTVFSILFLVYGAGQLLIDWTNKYYPDTPVVADEAAERRLDLESARVSTDKNKIAAVMAVVDIVTKGRGRIASIRKIT